MEIQQNEIILYDTSSKKYITLKFYDNVNIYACGPTVYRDIHIGNTRPAIIMDVLVRVLKKFTKVKYVRNITDIDDKIINETKSNTICAENKSIFDLTSKVTKNFHKVMSDLNILSPDVEPKATDHILEMISMIKILIKNNYAYEKNGHIFFNVSKFKDYGKISNNFECLSGARIKEMSIKKNSSDFVLWKPFYKIKENHENNSNNLEINNNIKKSYIKNNNEYYFDKNVNMKNGDFIPELIAWKSPWGIGRPGWHIECSAMSYKHLGPVIDIHGGGSDLAFPHHENEYAQSKCAHGQCKVKVWMHSGMIRFQNEKMSKSIGNIILAKDAIKKYQAVVVRFFILSTHYRQDLIWSEENIIAVKKSLVKLHKSVINNKTEDIDSDYVDEQFILFLKNDLNTVQGIARLHEVAKQANKGDSIAGSILKNSLKFLGVWDESLIKDDHDFNSIELKKINELIEARENARKNKNFELADKIRNELKSMNVEITNTKDGVKWSQIKK